MAATAPVNTVEASAKATQVDLGMQSAARAVLEQLGTGEISFSMDGIRFRRNLLLPILYIF